MVFCYKTVTESPRRQHSEPRRRSRSPMCRVPIFPSTVDQLINQLEGDRNADLLDIQEKDWRLLAALAKKREDEERQQLMAEQLHHVWRQEREQREMVEAETTDQYKRYLADKREQERRLHEHRRFQGHLEEQLRRGQLEDYIKHKERRSAGVLATQDGKKVTEILDKAIEEDARALLAADRRSRREQAEQHRRLIELAEAQRKVDEARQRRDSKIKDAQQRVAITNALSSWESTILRHEATAMEAARRAHHAARAALGEARSLRLARAREASLQRSRQMAAYTARLREAVKNAQ